MSKKHQLWAVGALVAFMAYRAWRARQRSAALGIVATGELSDYRPRA